MHQLIISIPSVSTWWGAFYTYTESFKILSWNIEQLSCGYVSVRILWRLQPRGGFGNAGGGGAKKGGLIRLQTSAEMSRSFWLILLFQINLINNKTSLISSILVLRWTELCWPTVYISHILISPAYTRHPLAKILLKSYVNTPYAPISNHIYLARAAGRL